MGKPTAVLIVENALTLGPAKTYILRGTLQ